MEVPAKFKDIVEKIEAMNVLDLSELVHLLEEKFGVKAQAAGMMMAAAPVAGEAAAEKSSFNAELSSSGENKIAIIKIVKEVLGLGLKEAKDIVDKAPTMLKEGMDKAAADALKKQVEEAGGKVTLK